jgi:putative FmdB family regulatory protein
VGTRGWKVKSSLWLRGNVAKATTKTAWVLSGTAPRKVTVPQMPRNPVGHVVAWGVGRNPSLQASAAAPATSATHETRLGMRAMINPRAGAVNLTAVSMANNVGATMPIYEYHCTKCDAQFTRQEGIEEHGRTRPACPQCRSRAVEQLLSPFFAKTVRKS